MTATPGEDVVNGALSSILEGLSILFYLPKFQRGFQVKLLMSVILWHLPNKKEHSLH